MFMVSGAIFGGISCKMFENSHSGQVQQKHFGNILRRCSQINAETNDMHENSMFLFLLLEAFKIANGEFEKFIFFSGI